MKRVLGLGNALTDILLQVSEGDLREIGFPKGSMNLINAEQLERIQTRFISVRKHLVAGGSASNTVTTIAQLGGKAAFIGKIGCDEVGSFYREDLIKNNVKPLLLTSSLMSGCCIVLITPDGERTFCTYLGAAADLKAEDIRKEAFVGYDICHVEGYLVQDHELIETALRTAKEQGCTVSLDLASYNVVNESILLLCRELTGLGEEKQLNSALVLCVFLAHMLDKSTGVRHVKTEDLCDFIVLYGIACGIEYCFNSRLNIFYLYNLFVHKAPPLYSFDLSH